MRRAHVCLLVILLLHAGLSAIYEAYFWLYVPDGGAEGRWMRSALTYWVPVLSLIYLWLRLDVAEEGVQFGVLASILATLFFPVGVPLYFFRKYPRRRALARTFFAAAFVGACAGAIWIGRALAHRHYTS
jgi:hypothetical protein